MFCSSNVCAFSFLLGNKGIINANNSMFTKRLISYQLSKISSTNIMSSSNVLKFPSKHYYHQSNQLLYTSTKPFSQTLSNSEDKNKNKQYKKLRNDIYDEIIRVNHAGELGAQQIYAGQLAVLQATSSGPVIESMAEQEKKHLEAFNGLIVKHGVRPSALLPLWNVAGYALGLGTALLGKEAAMACTVAVETVIGNHYNDQLRQLNEKGYNNEQDKELRKMIKEFRDDELEHLDQGLANDAEKAPLYNLLSSIIQTGSKVAIWTAKRF